MGRRGRTRRRARRRARRGTLCRRRLGRCCTATANPRQHALDPRVQPAATARFERDQRARIAPGTVQQSPQGQVKQHAEICLREVAAGNPQQVHGGLVGTEDFAIGRHREHRLAHTADRIRAQVQTDQDLARELGFEQIALQQLNAHPHQTHGVFLVGAIVAGDVEHADDLALRIEHRRRATGEEAVLVEEVFAPEDFGWRTLDQRGTDGVGPALALAPRGARRQRDLLGPGQELGIAHAMQHHARSVGQHHHVAGVAHLFVQGLDDSQPVREQAVIALTQLLQRRPADQRLRRVGILRLQPGLTTTLPGAQHTLAEQIHGRVVALEEQFSGTRNLFPSQGIIQLPHVSSLVPVPRKMQRAGQPVISV